MESAEELRNRAAMCRTLAPGMSTPAGRAELLRMAVEYDARAEKLEAGSLAAGFTVSAAQANGADPVGRGDPAS